MTLPTQSQDVERLDSCPLCAGRSFDPLAVPHIWIGPDIFGSLRGSLGLARCNACGLVFTNPRPSNERLGAFYSGDTYACHAVAGSASAGAKADFLLDRINHYLPAEVPRTLLDFGAGGGAFIAHALTRGWDARGFEPGKRGLETCRAAGLDVTDSLSEIPSSAFGVITLFHVFEHLGNPDEVLDEVRRMLRPDGRLVIEVPNVASLRARASLPALSQKAGFDERYRAFPIHLMYYTADTLRRMLEKSGWTVEGSFTLGLGLDELFLKPDLPNENENRATERQAVKRAAAPKRRLRHALRDAFLEAGLGENLAVVARPAG